MKTLKKDSILSKETLVPVFIIILSVFLIILTLYTVVGIVNKIKTGKYIGQDIESKNTISVSATGEIYAKPDLVLTSFSVTTEAETPTETMNANTEKMNSVIDFMKKQGIESKDLKTTTFNIYPRYEWNKESSIYPEGKRVLVGYEVSQSLQVKIRDLDKIGAIIEGAVKKGANQVGSLQFTIDNQDEFKKQARKKAIDEAKEKAEELSSQLDVDLVRITNFSEGGTVPRYFMESSIDMGEDGKGGGSPQIEIGENKIEVTVNITYEIN